MPEALDKFLDELDDLAPNPIKIDGQWTPLPKQGVIDIQQEPKPKPNPKQCIKTAKDDDTRINGTQLLEILKQHGPLKNIEICKLAGLNPDHHSHRQSVRAAAIAQRHRGIVWYDPKTEQYGLVDSDIAQHWVEFQQPAIDLITRMITAMIALRSNKKDIELLRRLRDKLRAEGS